MARGKNIVKAAFLYFLILFTILSLTRMTYGQSTNTISQYILRLYCDNEPGLLAVIHLDMSRRTINLYPLVVQCGSVYIDLRKALPFILNEIAGKIVLGEFQEEYTIVLHTYVGPIVLRVKIEPLQQTPLLPFIIVIDVVTALGSLFAWGRARSYEVL